MLWLMTEFVLLAAVVVAAGVLMTNTADRIADATGLGKKLVGIVLLAGATSLPELAVGITSVRMGAADLTAGNLLGATLCNLLVLAGVDLVTRTPGGILSRQAAAHALSATGVIILKCVAVIGILINSTVMFGPMGLTSIVLIGVYFALLRLVYFDELATRQILAENEPQKRPPLGRNAAGFLAAAAVIFLTAPELARVADKLSDLTGLGRTFMGTVFVAAVTTLPEVTAAYTAVRLKAVELAIGNAFGSIAFNMLILGVLDAFTSGPMMAEISDVHVVTAVCGMIVLCATVLSLLYRAERRWPILEPDALLVALLILGSFGLVYMQSR
ncbi:MAG: hypothetical protein KF774_18210 [Planctomyces sp.]|nr:hypothetical protein [Planctomyces sp.]